MIGTFKRLAKHSLPTPVAIRIKAVKYWWMGEPEIRLLPRMIPAGRNSVDVGAHEGMYTYHMARLSAHVFAYEPNPDVFDFIERGKLENTTLYPFALSDRAAKVTMSIPILPDHQDGSQLASLRTDAIGESRQFAVESRRLDDMGHTNIGFIKMDVEGHEEAALQGAQRILQDHRPRLLIEIEQRHLKKSISEVFRFVQGFRYSVFFLLHGRLHPLSEFNLSRHQDATALIDHRVPYVNNFLFVPSEEHFDAATAAM